jgi:tetraacyldisaccharide 4'-kinase
LDDAFQHRKLIPNFSILLFDYESLNKNFLFPVGNNRDIKDRIHACDCIVITKVPDDFNADALKNIFSKYQKPLFFGKLKYQLPVNLCLGSSVESIQQFSWLFFSGIAKPHYVSNFLSQNKANFELVNYKDHHTFHESELKALVNRAKEKKQKLLCTEKDWVKIQNIINQNELWKEIFYVLKVEMYFSPEEEEEENLIQLIYAKYRSSNQ